MNEASAAIKLCGRDKVVDSTIGAIQDDEGRFVALPSVVAHYRQLLYDDLMCVTPIVGSPEFQRAVIDFVFQKYYPKDSYSGAVATVGGNGAIRHVFKNYLEHGETVLIPDFYWVNYPTIANENDRTVAKYEMFDENNSFSLVSLKEQVVKLSKVQNNIVIVFNTPAHNPSGYSMTDVDWKNVLDFLKACACDQEKKFIVLVDIAYLDYAGDSASTRSFMQQFDQLPANILVTMAFSMSKSFTMYGLRCGALVAVSSSEEIINEFLQVNAASSRGVWSTVPRGAQRFMADVMNNAALRDCIDKERKCYVELITKRASLFLAEADKVKLPVLPYKAGFFIAVPAKESVKVADRLKQQNIFVLPLEKGLRIAICAIPTFQIHGLAGKIKEAMNS
jgi:aromatic-amino-acid transaminase